ncbi:uncharacterized protein LOC120255762 isoform X3 [Dioscorea cayenensis subsp. rotundata]|uniref:Uncharacterized protein LOC120255762 isoform X3 n=1 Tax=Dioscorea cayennensis subsp. rotundata TaxID=55577 RepID=A0AB40AXA9_DIOCR|nr:uncharacterized protein LOC120255762 isoform X3 [Dioscorea cayenensis subsp. rotundata]
MDFVGKLCIGAVCSCIQSPVVSEGMGHIFCTKEKLDSLDSPMEALMARKRDFETQLDIPCSSRQRPTYQLQFWLEKLDEIVMNGSGTDLRHLDLGHLQNLKNIVWKDVAPQRFFCNLQLLTINECLCEGIEELFTEEDGEIQRISVAPSFPA